MRPPRYVSSSEHCATRRLAMLNSGVSLRWPSWRCPGAACASLRAGVRLGARLVRLAWILSYGIVCSRAIGGAMNKLGWFRALFVRTAARGQGLVEYALILVLIAIVVIGILTQLGGKTSQVFSSVSCALDGGTVASSSHPGNPQGGGGGVGNNTTTTGGC